MLRLLGLPTEDEARDPLRPRARLLLARVVLSKGGATTRPAMRSFLWPEQSADASSASLRQLLSYLRQWEGRHGTLLLKSKSDVLFRDEACEQTDLDRFIGAMAHADTDRGSSIDTLYRGELLEGYLPGEPEQDQWLRMERQRLAASFSASSLEVYKQTGSTDLSQLLRAAERQPLDEMIVRTVMRHYARMGQAQQANAHFASFRLRLREELAVEPEEETRLLATSINLPLQRLPALPITTSYERPEPVAPSQVPMVLVLPPRFDGTELNPLTRRIADAFVDDVTLTLCRIRLFKVFAPQTARAAATEVGSLKVRADYQVVTRILPGRRNEQDLRFGFSVIHQGSSRIVVADEVEFARDNLTWAHAQLSFALARAICDGIANFELQEYQDGGAASAYVHYLLGCDILHPHNLKVIRRAQRSFRTAVKAAPNYSPAVSMLSRAKTFEWMQLGRDDRSYLNEARQLAERAVKLDGMDAKGHRELGHVALYQHDLDGALFHFEASATLAPHHADLLADQADVMAHASQWPEAKRRIEQAIELNPATPDDYLWVQGAINFFTHRYEEGLQSLKRMREQDLALRLMAACAVKLGETVEAKHLMERFMERDPTFTVSTWNALFPQRDPADNEHYLDALRLAGFPG